ncbi:MAG: selenocysteine-specific translation elongation factor [Planctomycetota bacterium]
MTAKPKQPEIVHAMVGTAGHVSHGKSTLVEILTGCRMNRLPEERERGLTINLGFAACFLPGDRLVGIVDVPGHKDFIRNMVAGAASIDILMLVVAADDGVMPQTEEHVKIARILGADRVMVVITKTDLVDAELLELVRDDVTGFMARRGFPDAPVICFSSKTLEGLDEVRDTLEGFLSELGARPPASGPFRMYVERVFSVKGYGTVVTGIPDSGALAVGDRVELLPAGTPTSVRAIQAYKYSREVARAFTCAAVNVRDVPSEAVTRGMAIVARGAFRATTRALVSVLNANDTRPLRRITEVTFHTGTAVVNASLRLIGAESLKPGEDAFAEVRMAEPVVIAPGDSYIVRVPSPPDTVGGGRVLSTNVGRLKRSSPELAARLAAAREALGARDAFGAALMAGPGAVLVTADILPLTGASGDDARAKLGERAAAGDLVDLGGDGWLVGARAPEAVDVARKALARYHAENRYAIGMTPAHVCRLFGLGERSFAGLAKALTADAGIALRHGRLALADFAPALSSKQSALRDSVLERVTAAGASAVARGTLVKDLGASESDMKLVLRLLGEEGEVSLLGNQLMQTRAFKECREKLLGLFEEKEIVGIGDFRELVGASRNLAVAILEQFDAEGLTRRDGKGRALVRRPSGG